jgi:hypothetical protein
VDFATSSVPIFWCVFGAFFGLLVLAATGRVPVRAAVLVLALPFCALWLGFALDLILAVRRRRLLTAAWMALWVLGFGAAVLALIRFVVAG